MIRAAQHFEITASQDFRFPAAAVLLASLAACAAPGDEVRDASNNTGIIQDNIQDGGVSIQDLVNGYAMFRLEADWSGVRGSSASPRFSPACRRACPSPRGS